MHKVWVGLGLLVAVILVLAMMAALESSDHNAINDWAKQHDYQILSIDRTILDTGPFWCNCEEDRFYRVELLDDREVRRVSYFRFRFGYDQEWYR